MKGDFSRFTFDPKKHYTGVRMQQGRVQLDADWNEQVDLQLNRERRELRDIIGYTGGPRDNLGFKVTANGNKLTVGKGHYYVAGHLCWNEHELDIESPEGIKDGTYLAYLEVWERHVTWLEDADIREVALGGPDTATRTQLVSQVKLMPVEPDADCSAYALEDWVPNQHMSTGRMAARSTPVQNSPDGICAPLPQAGYTGMENQLYRVEIHEIKEGKVKFKWSRENGCVATRCAASDGNTLTVKSTGWDDKMGFKSGDWVELTDEIHEKSCIPGVLAQLSSVGDNTLTIDSAVSLTGNGTVRRWEGQQDFSADCTDDQWIQLEDGIEIVFAAGTFQPGDYWTIPARAFLDKSPAEGQGDILWPKDENEKPVFKTRNGPERAYSPLAICLYQGEWQNTLSCQKTFPPLTDLPAGTESCCTVTIRPGDNIQAVIDSLDPNLSKHICLLPGTHVLDQTITIATPTGSAVDKEQPVTTITGCGLQTIVDARKVDGFAVDIEKGNKVLVEKFTILSSGKDGSVRIKGSVFEARNCSFDHSYDEEDIDIDIAILSFSGFTGCRINECGFVLDKSKDLIKKHSKGWISLQGSDIKLSRNKISGIGIVVWGFTSNVKLIENKIENSKDAGLLLGGRESIQGLFDEDILKTLEAEYKESSIESVEIVNNSFQRIEKSAILTSNELYGEMAAALPFKMIKISNNRISKCCQSNELELVENKEVAQAGILLQNAQSLIIDGNQITKCGNSRYPACGIFLHECEGVQISENIINVNGCDLTKLKEFTEITERNPYQGGIIALMLVAADESDLGAFNLPAASIHNNHILCPAGYALYLAGYGTISIQNNVFKSCGLSPMTVMGQGGVAGIIFIQNWYGNIFSDPVSPFDHIESYTLFQGNHVHSVFTNQSFTELSEMLTAILPIILSSNQLSVQNNQIHSRLHDVLNWTINLWAEGQWVNITGNLVIRDYENPIIPQEISGAAIYSEGKNITVVNNQANECILANGTDVLQIPNQHPEICRPVQKAINNIR